MGCITFHLIAGEPPFECENEVDTMRRLLAVQYYWPIGSKVSRCVCVLWSVIQPDGLVLVRLVRRAMLNTYHVFCVGVRIRMMISVLGVLAHK